ncbi:hypothetical protein A7K99_17915 [Tatumella citrea]|uniref:Uncharacterized protein n=1 Tax=Tatumella citrea TaxID=53336 RepID=A0A1Y0LC17_TATCI|nr:hypothetical protein A7K98_17930 [Tatumella citrea]ARU99498.1 hypothetical protein A7K99_17915 [Tatumella citrea]
MFDRNNQPLKSRLIDFGCWIHLSCSDDIAESVNILTLHLADSSTTVSVQKVNNIGDKLTFYPFVMIKMNVFNWLYYFFLLYVNYRSDWPFRLSVPDKTLLRQGFVFRGFHYALV